MWTESMTSSPPVPRPSPKVRWNFITLYPTVVLTCWTRSCRCSFCNWDGKRVGLPCYCHSLVSSWQTFASSYDSEFWTQYDVSYVFSLEDKQLEKMIPKSSVNREMLSSWPPHVPVPPPTSCRMGWGPGPREDLLPVWPFPLEIRGLLPAWLLLLEMGAVPMIETPSQVDRRTEKLKTLPSLVLRAWLVHFYLTQKLNTFSFHSLCVGRVHQPHQRNEQRRTGW